mgnify:CR=1 FL=1
MSSAADVHAMRISQRAAEEAAKGGTNVPQSPRSRLESFRAEQSLRQKMGNNSAEEAAAVAAAASRTRLETFQARMPASATSDRAACNLNLPTDAPAVETPSIPALSLGGVATGSSAATGAPLTTVRMPSPAEAPTRPPTLTLPTHLATLSYPAY